MVHAKILETPNQGRTLSDDKLAECVKQLSSANRDYYRLRAIEEGEAAGMATCCEARLAHEELAAAYRQLCRSNGVQVGPHLASELAMFRFNPKPVG